MLRAIGFFFSILLDWLTAVLDAPYILTSKEGE
jgi:hypothetical protein